MNYIVVIELVGEKFDMISIPISEDISFRIT